MTEEGHSQPTWPYLVIITGGLTIIGLFVATIVVFGDVHVFGRDCDFDRAKWNEARRLTAAFKLAEAYETAEPEVEGLVHCDDPLHGKSRAEVLELLGQRSGRRSRSETKWQYNFGVPEGLSDYPGLEVLFGASGRVETVSVPGYMER